MTTTFTRTAIATVFAAASLGVAGIANAGSNYVDYDKGSHIAQSMADTPDTVRVRSTGAPAPSEGKATHLAAGMAETDAGGHGITVTDRDQLVRVPYGARGR